MLSTAPVSNTTVPVGEARDGATTQFVAHEAVAELLPGLLHWGLRSSQTSVNNFEYLRPSQDCHRGPNSLWLSFGVRWGFVRGPFGIRSGSVRDPFGIRSGSIRDPFGIYSGSVQGPFGSAGPATATKKMAALGAVEARGRATVPPSQRPIRYNFQFFCSNQVSL